MNVVVIRVGAVAAFMAVSGLAAGAANPETRLMTYQNEIKGRPSGVYEKGGDLYVHVRIPRSRTAQMGQLKFKAALEANELLKRWAVDYTAPVREKSDNVPEGVRFAAKVADACNPMWRFNDWNVRFRGREVTFQEKESFLLGQIVSKDDVVKQIPPSFSKATPQETLFKILPLLVSTMCEKNALGLYGPCNAIDLMPGAAASVKAKEEFAKVNGELDRYLATSAFAKSLRTRAKGIREPVAAETWAELPQQPRERVSKTVGTVTNAFADVKVTTNVMVRVQTAAERKARGVAVKGEFEERTLTSDEEEIVETTTVTTVTVRRTVRRKVVKSSFGHPAFEDAFLSRGKVLCPASAQTKNGENAVAKFFDTVTPMSEKERVVHEALCENPGDSQLWNLYGRCLIKKNDSMGALICFRCAARLDTKNQYAITNLSIVYERLGCLELSRGMAVLAFGVATTDWCRTVSREILLKGVGEGRR